VGLVGNASIAHGESKWPSERGFGKRLKRMEVEPRGGRALIDVESGAGPVHAPCPNQRVAKPGGANRSTEIIRAQTLRIYENKASIVYFFTLITNVNE